MVLTDDVASLSQPGAFCFNPNLASDINLDQPIVMGRTYHEDNRSPGDLPGTKTQISIRSKTYKGGRFNKLLFENAIIIIYIFRHTIRS